ncbi:LRR receptor kinase SERK2 [Bienertia sinuspersici]
MKLTCLQIEQITSFPYRNFNRTISPYREKVKRNLLSKNLSSYFLLTELTTDRNNAQILSIPTPIGSLPYLEELYLDDNQLSGSIPSSLNKLSHIRDIQIQ